MTLEGLRKQQDEYTQKKMNVEKDLRTELSSNTGFLSELRAMMKSSLQELKLYFLHYYICFSNITRIICCNK